MRLARDAARDVLAWYRVVWFLGDQNHPDFSWPLPALRYQLAIASNLHLQNRILGKLETRPPERCPNYATRACRKISFSVRAD